MLKATVECRFFSDFSGCVFFNGLTGQTTFIHSQLNSSFTQDELVCGIPESRFLASFYDPPSDIIKELISKGLITTQ